jgi:hypothetical protein
MNRSVLALNHYDLKKKKELTNGGIQDKVWEKKSKSFFGHDLSTTSWNC